MNNKKLGTAFERFVCADFAHRGYWTHFITPDMRGSQPFDIIVVKNNKAIAVECKTLDAKEHYFPITRLEDNQLMAFKRWMACGNDTPIIVISWRGKIYWIPYTTLEKEKRIDLNDVASVG